MFVKHIFPDDWSKISDKKAIEYLKYLLKNYKKYKISILGDRHFLIGNVDICKEEKTILNNRFTVYTINKRSFTINKRSFTMDSEVGFYLSRLIYLCEQEQAEKAIKANKEKGIIFTVISFAFIIATIAGTVYMINDIFKIIDKERAKQIKIENEIKKYEKTLPYYNEYLQTKQQIQNRCDSLKKVY